MAKRHKKYTRRTRPSGSLAKSAHYVKIIGETAKDRLFNDAVRTESPLDLKRDDIAECIEEWLK